MPKLSGRKALYRGKLRTRVLSVTLTPAGHEALARELAREHLTISDYVEKVARRNDRAAQAKEREARRRRQAEESPCPCGGRATPD